MTFKKAYLKLTLFYVLIVMVISLVFSFTIFNISAREISRGFGKENKIFRDLQKNGGPPFSEEMRLAQIEEINRNLKMNLIYFNLFILVISAISSYFLAQKTLEPIEEAMLAQTRFTADASHELRTPLAAIKTEIEVALRNKKLGTTHFKKLLKSNLEEINKLESLSSSLLKLARADVKAANNFTIIDLEETIAEAYNKVEKIAKKKSISFKTDLKALKILGDQISLTELFVILLDNAIKYSHEKSKIYIEMANANKRVVIKIKDLGIGIKASDLPYIFNRFYRADSSRSKTHVPGFGLGLALAKEIIDYHHGTINVKSEPNKGTEFTISFPLKNI